REDGLGTTCKLHKDLKRGKDVNGQAAYWKAENSTQHFSVCPAFPAVRLRRLAIRSDSSDVDALEYII
ncbi:hypothetical protein, partial [Craterilacuibacter sp.]|uniref:hypothetical protein n=1 Tax=Craterilacuibacter sp. TaxID=2870909 RepID=UPI003F3A0D10